MKSSTKSFDLEPGILVKVVDQPPIDEVRVGDLGVIREIHGVEVYPIRTATVHIFRLYADFVVTIERLCRVDEGERQW